MGVLEARKDAETVGYPVVGETEKDASNVIDYNIHDEITKDTSAVINSNNDTTTGMANVIPGINAPKLIASTSIVGLGGTGGSAGATLSAGIFFSLNDGGTISKEQRTFTISSETGDLHFTQGTNGIIIPKTATYYIQIAYPKGGSSWKFDSYVKLDNATIRTFIGPYSSSEPQTETFFAHLDKGKSLWMYFNITSTGNITGTRNMSIDIQSIT